jgi:hypothetical protein
MAAIDHTCIIFKNGNYIPFEDTYTYEAETDEYVSRVPFEHGRDGDIQSINGVRICEQIKWYHDEYDALYVRDGCRNWSAVRKTPAGIWWWLKYKLHFMERRCYEKEVGVWREGRNEVYIYYDAPNQCNVSFFTNGTDSYVVIGGYGHHKNVYTHFMGRGYGEEFEEKMAKEAFWWACDDILVGITEGYVQSYTEEMDNEVNRLRKLFMPKDIYYERYSYGYWPDDLWEE